MYAIVFLFLFGIYALDDNSVTRNVSYTDFCSYVARDHGITKIIVYTDKRKPKAFSPTPLHAYFSATIISRAKVFWQK